MIRVGEFGGNFDVKLGRCSSNLSTGSQPSMLTLPPSDEMHRAALSDLQILTLPADMVGL